MPVEIKKRLTRCQERQQQVGQRGILGIGLKHAEDFTSDILEEDLTLLERPVGHLCKEGPQSYRGGHCQAIGTQQSTKVGLRWHQNAKGISVGRGLDEKAEARIQLVAQIEHDFGICKRNTEGADIAEAQQGQSCIGDRRAADRQC